jgi:ribosome maturation factor RimP
MEDKVRNLIEEEVNKLGVRIDNIEYLKENGNYFLRITIDKDDIVDLDTCVEVTNIINPILDKSNIIDDSYILDITTKEKGEK